MLLLVLKRQFLLKHITFLTIFTVATIQKDWQTWELEISAARTTRELTRCLFSLVNVGFGLGGDHCYTHQSLHISNFRLYFHLQPPVLRALLTDSSLKSSSRLLTVVSCQLRLQFLHHVVLQLHHQLHYEQCTVHQSFSHNSVVLI